MAAQPTFDLQVPGRPDCSAMDHFARRGYDCWCLDMEGYGRSTKDRDNNAPISQGADDCYAAALYIQKLRGKRPLLVYGISSGALRAAMFAERHPEMVRGLRSTPWCGPAKVRRRSAERSKKLPEFRPRTAGRWTRPSSIRCSTATIPAPPRQGDRGFCRRGRALDNSVPTGTYVDMCSRLPVVDPERSRCRR